MRLMAAEDDFSQALFLAKEINRMVGGIDMLDVQTTASQRGGPLGFSDIAVLYRTHRQAELIEKCLGIEGVPARGRAGTLAVRGLPGGAALGGNGARHSGLFFAICSTRSTYFPCAHAC